ncbi:MAG: hypothetical protein AAB840_02740 [Patescibacteria group bacterium]
MSFTKQPLFIFSFWLLVLIGLLHNLAVPLFFYWTLWWFDLLIHFLGGLWASTFLLWFLYGRRSSLAGSVSLFKLFLVSIAISIIIGLLWEGFELYGNIIEFPSDIGDSFSDIVADILGGLVAFFYVKKHLVVRNNNYAKN